MIDTLRFIYFSTSSEDKTHVYLFLVDTNKRKVIFIQVRTKSIHTCAYHNFQEMETFSALRTMCNERAFTNSSIHVYIVL